MLPAGVPEQAGFTVRALVHLLRERGGEAKASVVGKLYQQDRRHQAAIVAAGGVRRFCAAYPATFELQGEGAELRLLLVAGPAPTSAPTAAEPEPPVHRGSDVAAAQARGVHEAAGRDTALSLVKLLLARGGEAKASVVGKLYQQDRAHANAIAALGGVRGFCQSHADLLEHFGEGADGRLRAVVQRVPERREPPVASLPAPGPEELARLQNSIRAALATAGGVQSLQDLLWSVEAVSGSPLCDGAGYGAAGIGDIGAFATHLGDAHVVDVGSISYVVTAEVRQRAGILHRRGLRCWPHAAYPRRRGPAVDRRRVLPQGPGVRAAIAEGPYLLHLGTAGRQFCGCCSGFRASGWLLS